MNVRSIAANFWSTLACVAALSALAIAAAVYLFGLRWSGSIGLYFVVWWTVLFVVLPVGARSQAEIGEVVSGTEPGAPAVPALRERALWTTFASVVVFLMAAGLMPLSGL
jgi:predicted secreted protein